MSNALAVPAVTAALTTLVQAAVDGLNLTPRPIVSPGPLDDDGDNLRVGVHLYRVTRNAALSVGDLPTRSGAGQLRLNARVALDLHYLLTFRGNDEWESQALLARTAAALHAEPVITAARLALAEVDHPEIAGNDLAASEPVRITSDVLTVDELTRMWSLFAPGSFAITLAASAGPVLVDAGGDPGVVLPVLRVVTGVAPFDGSPRLDAVAGPGGPGAPVRAAAPMPDLHLLGARLEPRAGETTEVMIDGTVTTHTTVDDGHLVATAPVLAPGRHAVVVRRLGPPPQPALSTAPSAVLVVPSLGALTASTSPGGAAGLRSGTVHATVTPAAFPSQRVSLLLDSRTLDPPVALALHAVFPAVGTPPFSPVDFAVVDAPAGRYRATIEVDGARSLPELDAGGLFVLALVTL